VTTNRIVPVNEPLLDGNERRYLDDCITTGWISSDGPYVRRFEEAFAARVGRKHGIAVCNGSVAIDVAVEALRLGPGDEVIVPTFTIISCVAPLVRAGVTPVLVDADPVTWNMNVAQIEEKITPKTRAIMVVHIYGLPVEMDAILAIAGRHGLRIIEDAAEMHGQTYRGRPCGSFGDVSTFSFYANKHVTTGEGGMVVTDDDTIAERCRLLRNLAFVPPRRFVHHEFGWNFRMSNIQAALGVAQLERLDEFLARKRKMGARYTELLHDLDTISLPVPRTDYADNVYWVYGLVLSDEVDADAGEVMRRLGSVGVGTRPFFWPMHKQPVLLDLGLFSGEQYPVAERIATRGFYLPSGMALTDDDISYSAASLRQILR
jgi:perosamine synthetase